MTHRVCDNRKIGVVNFTCLKREDGACCNLSLSTALWAIVASNEFKSVKPLLGLESVCFKLTLTQYNQNLIQINFIEFIAVKTRLYLRVALSRYALFRSSTEWHSHVTRYSD